MNIEKMKEFVQVANELQNEGVYGFTVDYRSCGFQVGSEKIANEPNLQLKSRGTSNYPYEIYVEHEGFKIFALIQTEQLRDFPQFKESAKADLLKQLSYLEEDVDLSGMEEGVEDAS